MKLTPEEYAHTVTWLAGALRQLYESIEPIADYRSQDCDLDFSEGGDVAEALDRAEAVLNDVDRFLEELEQAGGTAPPVVQLRASLVEVVEQADDAYESAERNYWSGQAAGLRKAAEILGLSIEPEVQP